MVKMFFYIVLIVVLVIIFGSPVLSIIGKIFDLLSSLFYFISKVLDKFGIIPMINFK